MGSHHEPERTQEIPAVKELMKGYLKSVSGKSETPIYDDLMGSYVRYYGWDESNPYGVVWSTVNHPEVVEKVASSSRSSEGPHSTDEPADGAGNSRTREFAAVVAERLSVADADAIAESLMHDLPAARIPSSVPPHPAGPNLSTTPIPSSTKRTRVRHRSSEGSQ